ncbi:glycosyltransferase family 2 protein [Brasilonema bromeliae]|uniref:Glycosyltransferase n=1 Tax=Brasilonema bromeliae SPC951 TaxID=385972 RepID=A0ABX1P402_9CYAN|nr:glycosyltransferase family 2 protein [Brasilonema bromeliae]NMG19079.1 glycosyltransferase [Brasilonema bromeliae SPC951]
MNLKYPKITVVTPSYNQAPFLKMTLESILNQDYPNLEYIVIDGGSTDGSVDILRQYDKQLTYWVSEPDQGQTDALNKGFLRATGDILCWLCSDDLFESWTLKEVAQFFQDNPQARVVYGDSTWIDVEGQPLRIKKELPFNRFIFLYSHNFIPQPSTFWRRDLYEEVGGLNSEFDLAMDADLWMRFSEVTDFYHVRRSWSKMRLYPEQKTQRLSVRSREEGRMIEQRYCGEEPMWSFKVKKFLATSLRVGWKLAAGNYW